MNQGTNNNGVMTVAETAEFLRVSESIIRRLIRKNKIPYFKIEGRYLLFRPALDEWIHRRIVAVVPEDNENTTSELANELWQGKGKN
jgi:excisionase family DNA binding protein